MEKILTEVISRWKKLLVGEGLLKWAILTLFLLIAISFFYYFFPLTLAGRIIITWTNVLFLGLAFWIWIFCPLTNQISQEQMALIIPKKFPEYKDEIINALQLRRLKEKNVQEVSQSLINRYLEEVNRRIENFSPYSIGNKIFFKRNFYLLFFALIILLSLSFTRPVLLPWWGGGDELIQLQPKNAKTVWGQPLTIVAQFKNLNLSPVFKYRWSEKDWQKLDGRRGTDNTRRFNFDSVKESFDYYLLWSGEQTPVYHIEVVHLPELGDIYLKYFFPSYTNLATQSASGGERSNGDVRALLGTKIYLEAVANNNLVKAVLAMSDGQRISLKTDKNKVSGEFTLLSQGEYWIEIEDENNLTNPNPVHHLLEPVQDTVPEITLLSPLEDLVISEKANFPLTYSVEDDFGITKVELFYRIDRGEEKIIPIQELSPPLPNGLYDYRWDLSALGLSPGQNLDYYLKVWDNDIVSGPKSGRSAGLSLEVFSYEKEHKYIEEDLKSIQEKLFSLLEKQTTAKQAMEKTGETSLEWGAEEQKEIRKQAEGISADLGKARDRMHNDPLSTQKTVWENEGIKDNLDNLIAGDLSAVIENFRNRQLLPGITTQKQIIKELERIGLLSEDVNKYAKMEDIFNSLNDLMNKKSDLAQQLENLKNLADQKKLDGIIKALEELARKMENINKLLSNLPQELPEEFINQPAVKEINLGKMSDLIEKIKSAISEGNLEKAMDYLKKLSDQLAQMSATLEEAAQAVPLVEEKELFGEILEWQRRWQGLVEQESLLLNQTSDLENKQLEKMFQEQKKLLEELAKKQKSAQDYFYKTRLQMNRLNLGFNIFAELDSIDSLMTKVYNELTQLKIIEAPKGLKAIIDSLEQLNSYLVKNPPLTKEIIKIKKIEEEILEKLQPEARQYALSPEEKEKLTKLSQNQTAIQKSSEDLAGRIERFSRKSATIDPRLKDNLKKASQSMGEASDYLDKENINQAVDKEREALQYLGQGQEALQSLGREMSGREGGGRKPQAFYIQGRSASGPMGVRQGYVPLPSAEQYKVPKEFRQEILESLKEKYPKVYEKIIKEYYQKLSE